MTYSTIAFKAKEFVFRQGEIGDLMFLVLEGEVEIIQEVGGQQNQVAILERGDFFGEMAVLEKQPRGHSVRTLRPTRLIEIDRAGLQKMLARNTEIAVRMIRKLGIRLMSAEKMLVRANDASQQAFVENSSRHNNGHAWLVNLTDMAELVIPQQSEVKIGRIDPINSIYPDLDLTKFDLQLTTSRCHARLLRKGGGFYILEEKATNGTFVNGQRVSTTKPLEIRSNDDVMFGAIRMRFRVK